MPKHGHKGISTRGFQILHSRPRQTNCLGWNRPFHANQSKWRISIMRHQFRPRGSPTWGFQISHHRPRKSTRWPWTHPSHAKRLNEKSENFVGPNLDLRVILPADFKFLINDLVKALIDLELKMARILRSDLFIFRFFFSILSSF